MDWGNIISLFIGVVSFVGGLLLWYRGAIEKQYASQRDFSHIKKNYEQMSRNLLTMSREFDRRFDSIESDTRDIKSFLQIILTRGSDESISDILNRNRGD